MSSPPDNMKLEGLIEDNWDEDAVTPGIVSTLEPYREQIEDIAARFDPAEQSWRDHRIAAWSPVPESVMDQVRVAWVKAIDEKKTAAHHSHSVFARDLRVILDGIEALLLAKNAAYGDSALSPMRVFSRADIIEQIKVRIDDKLSRLARGNGQETEDVEMDLLGYIVLLRIARLRASMPQ